MEEIEGPLAGRILFGNGEGCNYFTKMESKNEDGLDDWVFVLVPESELLARHNFGKEFEKQGFIKRRYLKEHIFPTGVNNVLCTVEINNSPTNLSRKDEIEISKIHNQQRLLNNLQLKEANLHEEIDDILNNPFKLYDDDTEIFEGVMELRKRGEGGEGGITTDENE